MSTPIRIRTVIVVAMLVVCLGGLAGCSIRSDAQHVNTAAAKIAEFSLPAGYASEATAEVGGYLYVSYAPGDGHSHIILVQAPQNADVDQATLEKYIQQAGQNRGYNRQTRTQVVGQKQATVRGQTITFVINEGTNSDGQAYRSMTGSFQGKGGAALLSIESPIGSWNQAAVDQFIASIR